MPTRPARRAGLIASLFVGLALVPTPARVRAIHPAEGAAIPGAAGPEPAEAWLVDVSAAVDGWPEALAAPAVEACLNEAFMGFGFDAPAGGGIVIVSYPFVFKSS